MKHETAIGAIKDAMEDIIDNAGTFTPHNPAICRDANGWYFGSALHGESVVELSDGFGNWTPNTADDIAACAEGFAADAGL